MADNETTTPAPGVPGPAAPAGTNPVAPAAPVEHTLPTVDPKPLQNILDGLVASDPATQTGQPPATDKPDEGDTRRPVGDIANMP